MKANIQAVSLKIQTLKSNDTMAQAMKGVTKAMMRMNKQVRSVNVLRPKKNLVFFRFPTDPALLHATQKFFRGLRDFRKNPQNMHFLVILYFIIMFILFRIYFYNSIFILNDSTTYWT